MLAFVLLVPGVKFGVPVPGPFVLEEPGAVGAGELKLLGVGLKFFHKLGHVGPVISMAVT